MRIFALQTDVAKTKKTLLAEGEREIITVHPHWLPFVFSILRQLFLGIPLFIAGIALSSVDVPLLTIVLILAAVWFLWAFFDVLRAFINWKFNFLFLTDEKIVVVFQYMFFRKKIVPIMLETITSCEIVSQFGDIFPFGTICINLEQVAGVPICMRYIPHPDKVVVQISRAISLARRQLQIGDQFRVLLPSATKIPYPKAKETSIVPVHADS